jgi:nucleoside-diphosphate-sugar epimerase
VRVLLAGATSVLGRPLIGELRSAGHEVVGLTRSRAKARKLWLAGVEPLRVDVLDREPLAAAVREAGPEAVISLLIALPRYGPRRVSQLRPNLGLWGEGVPNLLAAAGAAGARRFLAESFVFAYGYGRYGPEPLDERSEPSDGAVIPGQAEILASLRGMERAVLAAGDLEGVVLRYGGFHGTGVPMSEAMGRALRLGVPVLPGGGHALLPFLELGDAARATVAALEGGRGGELYNVVDDRPAEVREYAAALAASLGAPRPRSLPLPLVRPLAPYLTCVLDHTRLPVANAKARRELGWRPRYPDFEAALAAGRL